MNEYPALSMLITAHINHTGANATSRLLNIAVRVGIIQIFFFAFAYVNANKEFYRFLNLYVSQLIVDNILFNLKFRRIDRFIFRSSVSKLNSMNSWVWKVNEEIEEMIFMHSIHHKGEWITFSIQKLNAAQTRNFWVFLFLVFFQLWFLHVNVYRKWWLNN